MTEMPTHELQGSPSMLGLFGRAGLAMVPGASRLPFVAGGGREIPQLTLELNDVHVERDRLAAYDRVCGFSLGDTLPATYPHMLAFPLHLALMTDGRFPFGAIGLVHITNEITQHRPIRADETLSIRVWANRLEAHPRGRQFTIQTAVTAGGAELVWESASTNLKRGGGSDGAGRPTGPEVDVGDLPATATWKLPGDLGRRYGSVSGDFNPIHVHPLSARLFGFPTAIAHGMWTKARCLAALESRLPDAFSVQVAFKKPILLPATVEFCERGSIADRGVAFGVRDARKATPHLAGRVTQA
jgi:acyl dehydratase